MTKYQVLSDAIIRGDNVNSKEITQKLLDQGAGPVEILNEGLIPGMSVVGKNLVRMMLEGAGFTVIDLGVDVPPEKFVEEIKKNKAQLLGLSALLTTTMPGMKEVIDAVKANEEVKDTRIIIGGAPLTKEYADSIGADGYAPDASGAVDLAKQLV